MSTVSPSSTVSIPEGLTANAVRRKLHIVAARPSAITQERLRAFYLLQEQYESEKRKFEAIEERYEKEQRALALQSIAGARITTGKYKPRTKVRMVRHPRYKAALIAAKGEEYQKRVLDETTPTVHYWGWVE